MSNKGILAEHLQWQENSTADDARMFHSKQEALQHLECSHKHGIKGCFIMEYYSFNHML